MERLFVYGTLQEEEIQLSVLGRIVPSIPTKLPGFRKCWIKMGDGYPIALADANSQIKGWIIEITKKELKVIDVYEGEAYHRTRVPLADGNLIWIYRENPKSVYYEMIHEMGSLR